MFNIVLQYPDLDIQEQFLIHFGMHCRENRQHAVDEGEDPQPFIEKCIKGDKEILIGVFS